MALTMFMRHRTTLSSVSWGFLVVLYSALVGGVFADLCSVILPFEFTITPRL